MRIKTHFVIFGVLLFLGLLVAYRYMPVVFEFSKPEVVALVNQLASTNPEPEFPGNPPHFYEREFFADPGEWDPTAQRPVTEAYYKLKAMGKEAFPTLVKHFDDRRYSHQRVSSTYYPATVGDACQAIVDEQVDLLGMMYKGRESPNNSASSAGFSVYVSEEFGSYAAYIRANRGQTLRQMRIEMVEWRTAREKRFGFVSDDQRDSILMSLANGLGKAQQEPKVYKLPVPDSYSIDALVQNIQIRELFEKAAKESSERRGLEMEDNDE